MRHDASGTSPTNSKRRGLVATLWWRMKHILSLAWLCKHGGMRGRFGTVGATTGRHGELLPPFVLETLVKSGRQRHGQSSSSDADQQTW